MPNLPQAAPPWVYVLLGLLAFLGIWCVVSSMISFLGGWWSLAKKYPAEETTFWIADAGNERRFRWTSLTMGPPYFPSNYGNCINVVVDDRGIEIRVMWMFRLMHPPVRIPWDAIESCETARFFLIYRQAIVGINNVSHPIRFFGKCGDAIDEAWRRRSDGGRVASPDEWNA